MPMRSCMYRDYTSLVWYAPRTMCPWTICPTPHCTDKIPKIRNKYSQEKNCAATVPIPTFMFLWAIYIFLWSIFLFCCREIGGLNVGIYTVDRSQTHECEKSDWGRATPFLGIYKFKFLCSAPMNCRCTAAWRMVRHYNRCLTPTRMLCSVSAAPWPHCGAHLFDYISRLVSIVTIIRVGDTLFRDTSFIERGIHEEQIIPEKKTVRRSITILSPRIK